jgi:hypothetical protein
VDLRLPLDDHPSGELADFEQGATARLDRGQEGFFRTSESASARRGPRHNHDRRGWQATTGSPIAADQLPI